MFSKLMAPEPMARPRGGWRMQQEAERYRTPPRTTRCRSALSHLRCWGEGKFSAVDLHGFMADMLSDGLDHPAIRRLAAINAGGERHCLENLLKLLGKTTDICKLLSEVRGGGLMSWCIKPTVFFAHLLRSAPDKFLMHMVGGNVNRIEQFWQGLFDSPHGVELRDLHPHLRGKTPADLKYTIPLRLHEDAGPFSKGGSVNIISWSSLLAKGKELAGKIVFGNYIKTAEQGPAEDGWSEFIADLEALAAGMQGNGQPIVGADNINYSAIMLFGGADLEVECMAWGLASYNENESDCCGWCLGDRRHRPLTDLRRSALWRPTERMSNDFFMERLSRKGHPISRAPFCNKYFFRLDVMHVFDHHGIACIVIASTIRPLILTCASLGDNQPRRLEAINDMLATFNSDRHLSVTIPPLQLANLSLDDWAELHGTLYKSAICRHAADFSLELAQKYYTGGDPYSVGVLTANRALCKIYEVLYSAGMFLNHGQLADISEATLELGGAFHVLRDIAQARGELTWHIKPKVHIGQHLPSQCVLINARAVQNYAEESLVGRICDIWEGSCSGPYHRSVQRQTLIKYLVVLALLLEL